MEFTRYWGQAEGAALSKIKETPGPAGAGTEGHRKKNTFIISLNDDSVKEIGIGSTVFWPCCRDVLEGDVAGEMMDFSTGNRLLAVLSYGGVSWFRPERLCRTAAEARKRIERSFLSGLEVTGKAERP